jgi:hypothetical protein
MADLFKPRGAATIRRPTDNKQQNGMIVNTPRFSPLGGFSNSAKAGPKSGDMSMSKPGDTKKVI